MGKIDNNYKKNGLTINLGLERIEALLNYCGNPQDKLKIIHVGGTNGKGSVSRFLYSILKEHGLKVGIYTSPHLVSFNERIIINDQKIADADIENLKQVFDKIVRENKKDFERLGVPTFFEITTAICFKYFFDNKVDIAILEVGLGGTLDATNIIPPPLISIITIISMDHKAILGNSLFKIATEKAGIIKKGSTVIVGEEKNNLIEIFKKKAFALNSDFFSSKNVKLSSINGFYNYKGSYLFLNKIKLNNGGYYQKQNLKLALLSFEVLSEKYGQTLNFKAESDLVRKGILKFENEGRFELSKYKNLDIILDGAHNPDGIKGLVKSLEKKYRYKEFIFIFSSMKDKDYKIMLNRLSKLGGIIIFAGLKNERQMDPAALKELTDSRLFFKESFVSKNIKEALKLALKKRERDELTVICGSLFLIGEFKKLLRGIKS